MTDQGQRFLAAYRRLSPIQAQAIREVIDLWHDGAGPDVADTEAWVHNRAAEIERPATAP